MATPPPVIEELVERFGRNIETYKSQAYDEAKLRVEFVNKFWKALGWDIDNDQGHALPYQDVIHEDSLKMGGSTKAPDYSFRIGGQRKFFLETKKPAVNIKDDPDPAYQLRRYAWTAKLDLSLLTDFESLAVYDGRVRPRPKDKASAARIDLIEYTDYPDKWGEIASRFSKEAILKGAFDKYAGEKKGKRGTAEVDAEFLKELEGWREVLARNIAIRNPALTRRELNYAVQMTIDRIVFLRLCEDRGIERFAQLQALTAGPGIYPRLVGVFRAADQKYNSGLFHFEKERDRPGDPDALTPSLKIDDKILKDILASLYMPACPYEFSVLPPEILGSAYERFLGKVITLTKGHQARIEEKPEVRKAGGVYYTPQYIVDYIVRNTVGRMIEGKSPEEISSLKILDPACGSGSFLLGAYRYLLDHHLDWYTAKNKKDGKIPSSPREDKRKKETPAIFQGKGGAWFLAIAEKKRVLLNSIFGVDIDPQACEVTKLSLLLKVLEHESEETLQSAFLFHRERALPDLGGNIKCGNALIGTDFNANKQGTLFDEDEQYRINAFDWGSGFSAIMKRGGFDCVIGNPPYIRIQAMKEWAPLEVEHYKKAYKSASKGNYDIYVVFVEKGLSLLNPNGRLGFILPHKFFNAQYGEPLREILSQGKHLAEVVHFDHHQVFQGATNYTCLIFLGRKENQEFRFSKVEDLSAWKLGNGSKEGTINSAHATASEWNFAVGEESWVFEKLLKMPVKFSQMANVFVGLQTSADPIFLFKDSRRNSSPRTKVYSKASEKLIEIESRLLKPVVRSGSVGRYWVTPSALVLFPYHIANGKAQLIPEAEMKSDYPKAWSYLIDNKKALSQREHGKFKSSGWYQLYPKNLELWERPKLLLPYMISRLAAYYDEEDLYFVNVTTGGFGATIEQKWGSLKYYCGLLNSVLLGWFIKHVSTTFRGGYFAANKQYLDQLPIRTIDFSNPADVERHGRMVSLVESMLDLHKRLQAARTPQEKEMLQRQIGATDSQIDALVYALYGLTEEEIRIVEEGP